MKAKVEALRPTYFELENESHGHNVPHGSETHFRLLLVSSEFEGLSRIDRQRRIQDLLTEERGQGLHALTLKLMTPPEWEKAQADGFQMQSPPCFGGSKRENR